MTHPLTGKRYPAKYFDPDTVETLLLLVLPDAEIPIHAVIEAWSKDELAEAGNWALRAHLKASDNDSVRVPARPGHVRWPLGPILATPAEIAECLPEAEGGIC